MNNFNKKKSNISRSPTIMGVGLVVLDIILNNGSKVPVFSAGGTCGNVLAGLSFFNWESKSISRAGKGVASGIMIRDLLSDGVDVDYITREEKLNTPRIIERVKSNGFYARHNFSLRCPACNTYLPRFRSPTLNFINEIIEKDKIPDVFFFDRVTPSTLKLAKEYRNSGTLIFFEPYNLKRLEELQEAIGICHILKFSNNSHKKDLCNLINNTTILKKTRSCRPNLIIQTLGELGLFYNYSGSEKWHYKKGKKLEKIFDTCGAGDWLTVGLLSYLQELAVKNDIKLIDTLNSVEFVSSALDFSQMLASLSSMFVGARGLSKWLGKNEILNITADYMKRNSEIIPAVEHLPEPNTRTKYIIDADVIHKNYCPTCLLDK